MTDAFHLAHRSEALGGIRDRVREALDVPGVYRFTGARGKVIYVGKSVAVRRRLLSYFRAPARSKEHELLRVAGGVEWEYLPNEFEALLREYRLIRAFRPRFNRHHRRMRRYAWIRMTAGPIPRLRAARTPAPDGSRYFGPFPAPAGLPGLLRDLEHAAGMGMDVPGSEAPFPGQLDLLDAGPEERPAEDVAARGRRQAIRFLEGRDEGVLEELESRSAARLRALRDEVVDFHDVLGKLSCIYRPQADDAAGVGTSRAYLLSRGRVLLRFPCPSLERPDTELVDRIRALASEPPPSPDALRPTDREEAFVVARWFRGKPSEWERTWPVERFPAG